MAFNSTYDGEATAAKVQRIGEGLALIRTIADGMTSGTTSARLIIGQMRRFDEIYNSIAPLWGEADIVALRTAAENNALGAVKTELDDLVIAFADLAAGATMSQAIDIGSTYSAGANRTQKLAAVNRSFTDRQITPPASIVTAAAALRDAIDAFRAV